MIEHLIKPKIVDNGHCKENVILEKDFYLYRFQVPYLYENDLGRYIRYKHQFCPTVSGSLATTKA